MADDVPAVDGAVVSMSVRDRKGAIAAIVRRLDERDIGIDDIAVRRPTLDDVFLTLTGHAAAVAEDEEDEAAA
jgi:ABC-2 type transport system ATP-binding protein